ncbi:dynamin-like GTPase mgm1 [Borealophlyctis nickersoniae]|nr:dynamin-like GTPase mgm1 [Borealophlyctis nickersoniae]
MTGPYRPRPNAAAARTLATSRINPLASARRRTTHFRLPTDPLHPSFQRRTVFSVPKTAVSLVRLPVLLVGAAGTTLALVKHQIEEWEKEYVPDWARDAYGKASDWVKSVDLSQIQLPEFKFPEIDLSGFKFPEPSSPTAALLGDDDKRRRGEEEETLGKRRLLEEDTAEAAAPEVSNLSAKKSAGLPPPDEDLMFLTKKMIEIRNLLKTVDNSANMTLPSIVVIGSQSSGKSSVLESIVGHEFLPKGNNMVTRRPIELTLIHTPDSKEEYGEFPQLGLGKVRDFAQVQKTLTDLNLAVPDSECVSSKPIELRVYSPNVPDLTLIDLPGYIQIHNRNQPAILKEKIAELCESYIKEPNIILAVCSADVDLANSEALRASRKVDPRGTRTIGVVTKMDLVDPPTGVGILTNKDYPLQLGYIGVVAKTGAGGGKSNALVRSEDAFFNSAPAYRARNVMVGTGTLRRRLMEVLEDHMGRSLHSVVDAVQAELEDARYQFKVHYNDRRITPESYVADTIDGLKQRFKEFAKQFGKPQVREEVRTMLEQRLLDICQDVYWADARIANLPRVCLSDPFWQARLDVASGALTKSGIGRSSVQHVVDILTRNMERLTATEPWVNHPESRKKVLDITSEILRSKLHTTIDQVENTIKPYKFEVECTELEWQEGQRRAVAVLEKQLAESQKQLQAIKSTIGRRRLRNAMKHVAKLDREAQARKEANLPPLESDAAAADVADTSGLPLKTVERAREANALNSRISILQSRVAALRSRSCSTTEAKPCCPEIYLSVVAEKLTYTAVMFIHVELLNEFFFALPREIDNRLYYDLTRGQILEFANENQSVLKHLEVQGRRETLEVAREKLMELMKKRK